MEHLAPVLGVRRVKVGARTWERKSGNCAELSQALLAPEPTCTDRVTVTWTTSTSPGGPGEKGPLTFNQNTLNDEKLHITQGLQAKICNVFKLTVDMESGKIVSGDY